MTNKILNEFSLIPENKAKLQNYLDTNFEALKKGEPEAKMGLQELIKKTFPKEVLDELANVLKGRSEYAIIIRNVPERDKFELQKAAPAPDETYSFYIGNALYEINDLRHVRATSDSRSSHIRNPLVRNMLASEVHRDSMEGEKEGAKIPVAEDIIFSCPYNGENAITNFINLRKAIEQLTPEERKSVIVEIGDKASDKYKIQVGKCDLNDALKCLDFPPNSENFLRRLSVYIDPDDAYLPENAATLKFRKLIDMASTSINIQPGDLVILNERNMFHQATPGDPESIRHLPREQPLSRIMIHNAGGLQI